MQSRCWKSVVGSVRGVALIALLVSGASQANGLPKAEFGDQLWDVVATPEGFEAGSIEVELQDLEQNGVFEFFAQKAKGPGFPRDMVVPAYDPIRHKKYEKVILGPTLKGGMLRNYDYWRYVTVYNVYENADERLPHWPIIQESCHDTGPGFASWSEEVSFSVELSSSVKIGNLGLGMNVAGSIRKGVRHQISRRARATWGYQVDHSPHFSSEDWEGVTYVQVYNSKTKEQGFLQPSGIEKGMGTYPYYFRLTNQNHKIKIFREEVQKCTGPEWDDAKKPEEEYVL